MLLAIAACSMSMNARVFAGIKRRPGNTAHAVCEGGCQSGRTRRSSPVRTLGCAKYSGTDAMPIPPAASLVNSSGEFAVADPGGSPVQLSLPRLSVQATGSPLRPKSETVVLDLHEKHRITRLRAAPVEDEDRGLDA